MTTPQQAPASPLTGHPGLPETGRTGADLLAELAVLTAADLPTRGGRTAAYVYDSGRPEIRDAAEQAYVAMMEVNGLDPTVFPSIVELERQVVGATAARLGGGDATPGIFTSGGTESIILAVKAARDARPDVTAPEIVVPVTAHAAFHKAGSYLRVMVRSAPVDPATYRADPAATAALCNENTVLVVASAPSYAHGVIDPVAEIAADAAARGIPCHVDACVGGWLLPWLADAGAEIPAFDLSVPGVTSLSCDLHKFGYAPKGASVLLFRDEAMRLNAYYACAAWPGYTVVNSTIQSSKGAGPLAGAWATFQALGADGYRELGRAALSATRSLIAGVEAIDGLTVLGTPEATLVAIGADPDDESPLDLFALADETRARGFFLQPQLSLDGLPANLHLTLTGVSEQGVGELLATLRECVEAVRPLGPPTPPADIVDLLGQVDLTELDNASFAALLPAAGVDLSGEDAARMAPVNRLLDALPPETREVVVTRFLSALYSPHLSG
ncbi:pyridoxal phosphate-dependent decarboxylase family protein [Streptomyces fructofermentans]|uniref:Aspartate aminotransferase family protein n=1 Tax=Streptomyces fructofermentans TaxID=152141 RepID=A0A918NKP8_9ACTN|nr:aspartate aminotransferase family protein [Streptomyces fructofermentans]GGX76271.1 aspartate aminotransferase family protein [Streptomyces fructofermentans]